MKPEAVNPISAEKDVEFIFIIREQLRVGGKNYIKPNKRNN